MRIDILYIAGCPNHPATTQAVRELVQSLAADAEVREIEVKDAAEATQLRFLGSPTVQIDGADIDPAARERTDHSFSCRRYGGGGAPPREMIESAVRERLGA